MKNVKNLFPLLGAMALLLAALPAQAALKANLGITSNYVFRGDTQTGDDPAVQGGLEYNGGFYAGIWASQVGSGTNDGVETDGYIGIKGKLVGQLGFDLGAITYQYSNTFNDADELYAGLNIGPASLTYFNGSVNNNDYTYLDFKVRLGMADKSYMDIHFGHYDVGDDDYSVSLSKEFIGLLFSVSATHETGGDETELFATVVKEFEFK